jgi:hypothetical protein
MRTIFKVGIIIFVILAIALGSYVIVATCHPHDTLVYSNVKITNISLQNWGDDFVYLDNGAVIRVWNASGLRIGQTYDVYRKWDSNDYRFVLVS